MAKFYGVVGYGIPTEVSAGVWDDVIVERSYFGDIVSLSIFANRLVERGKQVFHGMIREVSLVLSGANPGALIDNVSIAHADGEIDTLDDEAIIYTGLALTHSEDFEDEDFEDFLFFFESSELSSLYFFFFDSFPQRGQSAM